MTEAVVPSSAAAATAAASPPEIIEIGIVTAGPLDAVDKAATRRGVERLQSKLIEDFQATDLAFEFRWVARSELVNGDRAEPSVLLRQAESERDAKGWDFAFVITMAELSGKYSSDACYAALSRPFDAAVFSTRPIDPFFAGKRVSDADRIEIIATRLCHLMLHAIGHLGGLAGVDSHGRRMHRPTSPEQLDQTAHWTADERQRLACTMSAIADQRLEETSHPAMGRLVFFAKAVWIGRTELVRAVWAARPWQFPRRFTGLTIASVSTVLILLMTAEAWDLALSQTVDAVVALTIGVVAGTTAYVVVKQQLLIKRGRKRSEQSIVTSASAVIIVSAGMASTWICLSGLSFFIACVLFPSDLIIGWAASRPWLTAEVAAGPRLLMSCFSSSIGLLIGALGVSFESQNYFQHIIFVDEEI